MGRVGRLDEVRAAAAVARRRGHGVIFTNGAFDLLHVGHVRYLRGARQLGPDDLLVVAVNSDASVRRAKGPERPVMPLAERMEIVAAIAGVDWVLELDADTADGLIEALRPEIHAKGSDYTVQSVPERPTVEAAGGRVIIVGDPKDHSTSGVIDAIVRGSSE